MIPKLPDRELLWWLQTKLNQDRQGTNTACLQVKVWMMAYHPWGGSIDAKDNEPVIVVGFWNNKDA